LFIKKGALIQTRTQTRIPILPASEGILTSRTKWQHTGAQRPEFAEAPKADEESVWDYPRPPLVQPVEAVCRVFNGKTLIAESQACVRVCETAGAPTYYFPPTDVESELIEPAEMASICEWKGVSQHLTVDGVPEAGWRYIRMFEEFADLFEWPSFHPKQLLCFIDTERVSHQDGGFYGGWVSESLSGPIKGRAGSEDW
jgi:uncharacterized protein (DUF427 family)